MKSTPANRRSLRFALALVTSSALALLACSGTSSGPEPTGGLAVTLETDMSIPKDIDEVRLSVTQGGHTLLHVDRGAGTLSLPATFEVAVTGDPSPVSIQAVAYKGGEPRVERDAITPIPEGHVGEVRVPLNYLCVGSAQAEGDGGVGSTCPGGETCVQGTCNSAVIPPSAVPTYPGSASGPADAAVSDGAPGSCFDVVACFASASPAAADLTACTVPVPPGASAGNINLAVQFPAGGTGICGPTACWIVLTDWMQSGGVVVLPAAACAMATAQGGMLVVSTACGTEPDSAQPCGPWSTATTPLPEPTAPPVGQSCTDPLSQSCGFCGAQMRTCMDGVPSPWSACMGEGVCQSGATQSCNIAGATQTCDGTCQWGACTCPAGQENCNGTCIALTDVHNCGRCGDDCTALPHVQVATCSAGQCALGGTTPCATGYADCNGDPTDGCETSTMQPSNCGSCGKACGSDAPVCSANSNGPGCATGCGGSTPTLCSGTCVDTTADPNHCGTCGNACTTTVAHATAACDGSACTFACNPGYTLCNGACVDVTSDAANCGGCGTACAAGSACQASVCQCSGGATRTCGNCNLGAESRSCDGTGTWSAWSACSGGGACAAAATQACGTNKTQTCSSSCAWGSCGCSSGYSACGGSCVNEQTDNQNCGSCGNACAGGAACTSGKCGCVGSSSQSCGNCDSGTQTRTCNAGTWSAWSACNDGSTCSPGSSVTCSGGVENCSISCSYQACCDPSPYQVNGTTMVDPSTGYTWQRTGTGLVNWAGAQAACAALGGSWHVPTQPQLDTLVVNGFQTPGVNTCALSVPFDTGETETNVQLDEYYVNRFWTSSVYTPNPDAGCTSAQWVTDLWTGDSEWFACPGAVVGQVLCLE